MALEGIWDFGYHFDLKSVQTGLAVSLCVCMIETVCLCSFFLIFWKFLSTEKSIKIYIFFFYSPCGLNFTFYPSFYPRQVLADRCVWSR